MRLSFQSIPTVAGAARRVFWAAVWLAIVLIAVKAYHLGVPAARAFNGAHDYLLALAAISYVDVLFAAAIWTIARLALALAHSRRLLSSAIAAAFIAVAALSLV